MKRISQISVVFLFALVSLSGCTVEEKIVYTNCLDCPADFTPPATPRGVRSVTGDGYVDLYWEQSDEADLAGYDVYRGRTLYGEYDRLATVEEGFYRDRDVRNAHTYYYAVSSFDHQGNESDLSYEEVFDTPRPAGYDVVLYDPEYRPALAGFDFSRQRRTPYDSPAADIVVDYDEQFRVFFIDVGNDSTDIQDFGFSESLDAVDWAPLDGWSQVGWVEAVTGHSYIVWTGDNHFAKFRITEIGGHRSMVIDWAYQRVVGYPELKPPARGAGFLRPSARTATMARRARDN